MAAKQDCAHTLLALAHGLCATPCNACGGDGGGQSPSLQLHRLRHGSKRSEHPDPSLARTHRVPAPCIEVVHMMVPKTSPWSAPMRDAHSQLTPTLKFRGRFESRPISEHAGQAHSGGSATLASPSPGSHAHPRVGMVWSEVSAQKIAGMSCTISGRMYGKLDASQVDSPNNIAISAMTFERSKCRSTTCLPEVPQSHTYPRYIF